MAFKKVILIGGKWEGFLGPRDWSPAIDRAKEELKALQTMVPEGMRVGFEELRESGFPEFAALVEQGFAFVIKSGSPRGLGINYHAAHISPRGEILMALSVEKQLWGMVK
jgi:hypothetical protein